MAKISPSLFATQTGTPSRSTEMAVSSARSATAHARRYCATSNRSAWATSNRSAWATSNRSAWATSNRSAWAMSDHPAAGQLVFNRGHEALLDLGDADALDQVGEEPTHDQAAGGPLVDAARHQVEELLVVEAARRGRVSGAGDLAGLDLEVG